MDEGQIMNKIQEMMANKPEQFAIVEEQIDVEIQLDYFKTSQEQKVEEEGNEEPVEIKCRDLNNEEISIEEKRKLIVQLASMEEVEAFRCLESYAKIAPPQLKDWMTLALRESKLVLESSLLDQKQILISTGLGGKGNKLRYFIVLINNEKQPFTDTQKTVIGNEIEFALKNSEGELESLTFEKFYSIILLLLPLSRSLKEMLDSAVNECNQYGDFLMENFLVTNVKKLTTDEIDDFIEKASEESSKDEQKEENSDEMKDNEE